MPAAMRASAQQVDDPAAFWHAVSQAPERHDDNDDDDDDDDADVDADVDAYGAPTPPPVRASAAPAAFAAAPTAAAASAAPPAALNVPWLVHLAGPSTPPCAPGASAGERAALLAALAAALPELTLYVEPLIAARGVPPEAFLGARAAWHWLHAHAGCERNL
jgi:hypothetical protein